MTKHYEKYKEYFLSYAKNYYKKHKLRLLKYHKTTEYKNKKRSWADKWKQKKISFIMQFKHNPCADCGIQYNPWQMDFDHIAGQKVYNIGRLMYHSESKIIKELVKCELVCSNCHRERTYNRY